MPKLRSESDRRSIMRKLQRCSRDGASPLCTIVCYLVCKRQIGTGARRRMDASYRRGWMSRLSKYQPFATSHRDTSTETTPCGITLTPSDSSPARGASAGARSAFPLSPRPPPPPNRAHRASRGGTRALQGEASDLYSLTSGPSGTRFSDCKQAAGGLQAWTA